jgi:teichuronic acid biosynthesis glycosyltransferase TuaC
MDNNRMGSVIRLLTFTTLYPNHETPNHGVFVENRLRHLLATGAVRSVVLAPVPFFPSGWRGFGKWGASARVPHQETRYGITVEHPRYLVIPKIGMSIAPASLYAASVRAMGRLLADGLTIDAIDAHYLYPDGVAAVLLGKHFRKPVVITARGSDVTQIPDHPLARRMIQWAIKSADGLISVSAGLKGGLVRLGAVPERVTVLRNGVDTAAFRPVDRDSARAGLGLSRPTLLSVGALIERKRHHYTIEAMLSLPEFELLIVGEGPERLRLAKQIERLGLTGRVRLLGAHPHAALPQFYGAADASILASSREGWANVLLESMACGTPVVASRIPGNPEVVQTGEAGLIVKTNTPAGLAEGVRRLFAAMPDRETVRSFACRFGWQETSMGQLELFHRVLEARASRTAGFPRCSRETTQPTA